MLKLDEAKLRRQVEAGDVPQVGQYDPSDELHALVAAAQDSTQDGGPAITATAGEEILIYPESNSEDRPIVAVMRGCLTLLGHEWKLPEDGDGATEATVEAVADVVQAANALLETLDRQNRAGNRPAEAAHVIAQGVPREDEWRSAASFMEHVAGTLDRFGVERPEHYAE